MKKPLVLAVCVTSILFCALTIWGATVRGIYEKPNLDNFIAGAGDGWLLLRGALALTTAALLLALLFVPQRWYLRPLLIVGAVLVIWIFGWSCESLQRWAPGYSEAKFLALKSRFDSHQSLTTNDFLNALGPPIVTGHRATGELLWSYSFMPSSGFGWDKRIVYSRDGEVTEVQHFSEP